jgi:ATP-dependent DNA helicase RecQ
MYDNRSPMKKFEILKEYFGYTSFRTGQEELIDNILDGRDTLGIMPTGAGKSICFQLPALMHGGITIVISPLISLMKDQVFSLTQSGISAAYINSSLNHSQYVKVLQNAEDGVYKIIYVAPERLLTEEFVSFSHRAEISMVTVDESHCVSQWGQDFRPSYLKIAQFIGSLEKRPVVTAFTATATPQVRDDIIDKLELKEPHVLTTGFDRKNLHFSVRKPEDKYSELKKYIKKNRTSYGIVYCSTRKSVDEVYSNLQHEGFRALRYHAGLSDRERKENQEAFIYDKCNIMVATNAFGMGIDKSNVSFVIHYNMPKNIESYYQEAGRAGRDGGPADCILFYSGQDVIINQYLIDISPVNEELDEKTNAALKDKDRELLKAMTFYCHTRDCLREYILNYFGEKTSNFCGNCSNCETNFEEADVTVEAQKIMSCVKRCGERYGIKMIVDVLRGSKNQKVLSARLDKISTYGLMNGIPEDKVRDIINTLVLRGFIEITNSEYPVVKLTSKASEVLFNGAKVEMKVQKQYRDKNAVEEKIKQVKSHKAKRPETGGELFERLRVLRNRIATSQRVPSYIVFTDATLWDMCEQLPSNDMEFLKISGVGKAKLEKYGEEFMAEIRAWKPGAGVLQYDEDDVYGICSGETEYDTDD